jgi:pSer/pThr/pTyr-binding forkhead associated (FHA) protein
MQQYGGIPGAPPPVPYGGGNDTARDAAPPKILRGFLVAYGSNPNGDFWPLTGGRLTVGRLGGAEGIDISLQDPTISSRHAAMVVDAASGSITVEDTGSTNGTFVNDEHIGFNGRRDLRDGDRLRFGGFSTIVKLIGRF